MTAQLHTFPAERIVRSVEACHPGQQSGAAASAEPGPSLTDAVVVTHRGMSKVYDCPQDLHAAVLVACGPELRQAERRRTRRRIRRHARAVRRIVTASARVRARAVNRWLEACVVAGAGMAILLWGWGL